jgi:hypothetical protein
MRVMTEGAFFLRVVFLPFLADALRGRLVEAVLRLEVFAFLLAGAIGGNAIVSPSGGK